MELITSTNCPQMIGFACAYTPLALIDAAGFVPYRVLPVGGVPDRAGGFLHDNVCPHVKRILDRALAEDFPKLSGFVLMNSCDAMRRLADSLNRIRPDKRVVLVDLPVTCDKRGIPFFAHELSLLLDKLSLWSGRKISEADIEKSVAKYAELSQCFKTLQEHCREGKLHGGSARLQTLYNGAVTQPTDETLKSLKKIIAEPEAALSLKGSVPVFLFGNVLPDPEAFTLFESCGAHVVAEDLCTGSRMFSPIITEGHGTVMTRLAHGLLTRPACARTLNPKEPGKMANDILAQAKACNARGVIGHTVKFCDPYLARLPAIRQILREADLPLLVLEGDCTLRSIGQHRTRIEAFVEMLR